MITKIHYNRSIGELWMWMIFFEWIITDGILNYILENREKIHQDMELRLETDTNRKRHELSASASSLLSKHHVELKFSFE